MEGRHIEQYASTLFANLYAIWHDWHVLKILPHGKGPLDERPIVIRWIKRFEAELASMRSWEQEREREKLPVCRAQQRYS